MWEADIRVGLTGAFLCSRIFGGEMAKRKSGVIVNVASDLAVIAPDQRLYRVEGLPERQAAGQTCDLFGCEDRPAWTNPVSRHLLGGCQYPA